MSSGPIHGNVQEYQNVPQSSAGRSTQGVGMSLRRLWLFVSSSQTTLSAASRRHRHNKDACFRSRSIRSSFSLHQSRYFSKLPTYHRRRVFVYMGRSCRLCDYLPFVTLPFVCIAVCVMNTIKYSTHCHRRLCLATVRTAVAVGAYSMGAIAATAKKLGGGRCPQVTPQELCQFLKQ